MFFDYSISTEQWRALSEEQKRERRISIRTWFLGENRMPGTHEDRLAMATFEDQFDLEFHNMEATRFSFGYHGVPYEEAERRSFLLLLQEHLVGILRKGPKEINLSTKLPEDPELLLYLVGRINSHEILEKFDETLFLGPKTVGELIESLISADKTRYPDRYKSKLKAP